MPKTQIYDDRSFKVVYFLMRHIYSSIYGGNTYAVFHLIKSLIRTFNRRKWQRLRLEKS